MSETELSRYDPRPAPIDVQDLMPEPNIPICEACIESYRDGIIEPGQTTCERETRRERDD